MTALLIVPVVGALGMAIETADWYMNQRAAQNAADSAAISAGLNGGATGGTACSSAPGDFDCEAQATAGQFGFTNGSNNATVTVNCYASKATGSCTTAQTCPGGASQCYEVTVTKLLPISIMGVVGYQGDAKIGSQNAVKVSATSWSRNGTAAPNTYCILTLDTTGDGISTNGAPKFNSGGCSLFSDSSTLCHGHSLAAEVDAADSADSTCSSNGSSGAKSNQTPPTDAWKALATTTNIPDAATSCGGTAASNFPGTTLNSTTAPSGKLNLSTKSTYVVCGNLTLAESVAITSASPGTTIIIYNGTLEFAGFTLSSAVGSGVTIVFTGTTLTDPGMTNGSLVLPNGCTKKCPATDYFPQGDGTLDISAPTSGTWSGVAVYVNPNLTDGSDRSVDGDFAGNGLTWDIQGLYYSPQAQMTFSGAENKDSNQLSCFSLVVKDFSINGTGSIFSNPTSQCGSAGLTPPSSGSTAQRAGLVG